MKYTAHNNYIENENGETRSDMPVDEINTLVGEFVNVMHEYGHGSGRLINPREDYYYVVIGKSSGPPHDEITIHFSLEDVSSILSNSDVTVIMLEAT